MAISASILVTLVLGDDTYRVDLSLPSSNPTAASPFLFDVTSTPTATPDATPDTLLNVAIGGNDQVYVAVAPPESLLVSAGVSNVITNLQVVVAEGTFDSATQTFTA